MEDKWDLEFKGVSIWPYIRFEVYSARVTSYSYKGYPTIRDVTGFLKFLMLPLVKAKVVVFIPDRREMSRFIKNNIDEARVFKRKEKAEGLGDVFFIEALRLCFRLIGGGLHRKRILS